MSSRRTGSSETPAVPCSTWPSWTSRIAGETSEGLNAADESCTAPISFGLTGRVTTAQGIRRRVPASGATVSVPASTLLRVARDLAHVAGGERQPPRLDVESERRIVRGCRDVDPQPASRDVPQLESAG